MTTSTLSQRWVVKDTQTKEIEIEADHCVISVKLDAATSTPRSITREETHRRKHTFTATHEKSTVLFSLTISDDPVGEPFQVEYDQLLPVAKIQKWLESRELEKHFSAVIQAVVKLEQELTQPSQ